MKTYQIREGEYASREEVVVEIVEEVVETKTTAITEANILRTIEFLEQKKTNFCMEVDKEIALNEAQLEAIREVNASATLTT
jgi:hypothetical protein